MRNSITRNQYGILQMIFGSNTIQKIEPEKAIAQLRESGKEFLVLFEQRQLSVEIYKPDLVDRQTPHNRDEFYLIISGKGEFKLLNETTRFKSGDFIYVPKCTEHRFINFFGDFISWVFFIGDQTV